MINMKQYTIAIDTGKAQTKGAMILDNEVITLEAFASNVVSNSTDRLDETVHVVRYNGEVYQVGDVSASLSDNQLNNLDKRTTESKVCVFTAIALMMKKAGIRNGAEFKLLVNVPLSQFKSEADRKAYSNFYRDTVTINVDSENFSFDITEVTPLFESIGYALLQGKALKGSETLLFDWGGLNLTYCLIDADLRPVVSQSDSLMAGSHHIISDIYLALQAKGISNIDKEAIKNIIRGRKNASKEVKEIIDTVAYKKIEEIFTLLKSSISFDDKIRFTGGSSLLFEKYITKYFATKLPDHNDFEISSNCVYDNAVGFLQVIA